MEVSLEEIARALNGDVRGGQVLAPGPGHSAEDRSLSIALSDKASDGFIVKSFANDDWRLCKDYVLEKLGLPKFQPKGRNHNSEDMARLIQEAVASQRKTSDKAFTVAYDYRDRDGTLLYQVLRYDNPKRFGSRTAGAAGFIRERIDAFSTAGRSCCNIRTLQPWSLKAKRTSTTLRHLAFARQP